MVNLCCQDLRAGVAFWLAQFSMISWDIYTHLHFCIPVSASRLSYQGRVWVGKWAVQYSVPVHGNWEKQRHYVVQPLGVTGNRTRIKMLHRHDSYPCISFSLSSVSVSVLPTFRTIHLNFKQNGNGNSARNVESISPLDNTLKLWCFLTI